MRTPKKTPLPEWCTTKRFTTPDIQDSAGVKSCYSGFLCTSDRAAGVPGRLKANVRQQGVGAAPGQKGNQVFGERNSRM